MRRVADDLTQHQESEKEDELSGERQCRPYRPRPGEPTTPLVNRPAMITPTPYAAKTVSTWRSRVPFGCAAEMPNSAMFPVMALLKTLPSCQ